MNKKSIILITFCLSLFSAQAQQKNIKKYDQNNWKSFTVINQQSAKTLAQNKAALTLGEHDELELIATSSDALGFSHHRYQQFYKNIPIEGAIYIFHEKDGSVTLANGKLVRQLEIDAQPILSEAEARLSAIQQVPATLYAWETIDDNQNPVKHYAKTGKLPKGALTIVDPRFTQKAGNYHLAYRFNINAIQPFIQNEVYVDAHTGKILMVTDQIHSCTETNINTNSFYNESIDVSICADEGTTNHLKSSLYGGLEIRDFTNNNLLAIDDSLGSEVLWATQKTFNYFSSVHDRNIADSLTVSKINYSGEFFGAFYYSSEGIAVYSDGNSTTHHPYTTPDIIGHELMHGINKFSAGLINRYESGALNESFADIFGELVEAHCTGSTDWITGAPVSPGNNGLRNLANPKDETMKTQQPHTYLGENWRLPSSICINNNDNCGVHRNSGVQNYWFYLLANGGNGINDNDFSYRITGIGREKAAKIAYRNLTTYLTPSATYVDARQGSIQAAIDLFGADSFEAQQTEKAWYAVGVSYNPIRLQTTNEAVLADGTIAFELLIDSLNLPISANQLTVYLDDQNNYDVLSVELLHTGLVSAEISLTTPYKKEISINRINASYINTNEPLFKIRATSKLNTIETGFAIKGGTTTSDGGFIPFEEVLFDIPQKDCSAGNAQKNTLNNIQTNHLHTQSLPKNIFQNTQASTPTNTQNIPNTLRNIQENIQNTYITPLQNNGLPLIASINYESCTEPGSATVKIIDESNPPYAHIWRDEQGTIVFQYVGYERVIKVPNLRSGLYQVTVNDTGGNCAAFNTKIQLLTQCDGNNRCNNRCPDYLITPVRNLVGTYNAQKELEIKGFVDGSRNTSFNICN